MTQASHHQHELSRKQPPVLQVSRPRVSPHAIMCRPGLVGGKLISRRKWGLLSCNVCGEVELAAPSAPAAPRPGGTAACRGAAVCKQRPSLFHMFHVTSINERHTNRSQSVSSSRGWRGRGPGVRNPPPGPGWRGTFCGTGRTCQPAGAPP